MPASKQELIRRIKRLNRDGEPLNHTAVNKSHNTLLAHATEQFGSWQAAIEAAGMDYRKISKIHRWSKDEILERLRELHSQGKIRDVTALSLEHPRLFSACRRHFGTGRLALHAAGFDYDQLMEEHPTRWTKSKVIAHLRRRHAAGKSLTREAILRNEPRENNFCYAVLHHFGTWGAALRAAKIDPQEVRDRDRLWPKQRVLEEIRNRHQQGKLLHTDFMQRHALRLHAAGRRHFGTWRKAVERAGINYTQHIRGGLQGFTRARTIRSLCARLANNKCSERRVRSESPTLYRAVIHHFGNWQAAMKTVKKRS